MDRILGLAIDAPKRLGMESNSDSYLALVLLFQRPL